MLIDWSKYEDPFFIGYDLGTWTFMEKILTLMAGRDVDSYKARWYSHLKQKQGEFLQNRRDHILSQN